MKTLHVIAFEKFLPIVIDCAEAVNPGQNRFVVLDAAGNQPYASLNDVPVTELTRASLKSDASVIDDLQWCDAVFLHPLLHFTTPVINHAPSDTVVVWCAMGGDVYALSEPYRDRILLPHSAQARENAIRKRRENRASKDQSPRDQSASAMSKPIAQKAKIPGLNRPKPSVLRAAQRVDLYCVRQDDLEFEKALPNFTAQQAGDLSYYTLDQILPSGTTPVEGPDILIGNSATWANNHLDLFEQMRDLDLTGRRIVLPLSYGGLEYADLIEKTAHHLFGADHITILRDWMPIDDYNDALGRCGTVLMNHVRAQAMGNISAMLLRGAHVWLHPENQLSKFFGDMGVSFSHLGQGPLDTSVFVPLSPLQKARNAQIMAHYWSARSVHGRWRSVFDRVEAEVTRKGQKSKSNRAGDVLTSTQKTP